MANVIPDKIIDAIVFSAQHVTLWTGHEAAIGLTAIEVGGLGAKTTTAQTSLTAQTVAQTAAKSATTTLGHDYKIMRDNLAILIAKIKAFADQQANPAGVYAQAGIPMPEQGGPAGPPVDATDVSGLINNAGWVELKWKGSLAYGQFFSVWRQFSDETTYTQLGAVAAKTFVDNTVPTGKAWANYVIRAHRGTQVTAGTEPVSVLFGVGQMAA